MRVASRSENFATEPTAFEETSLAQWGGLSCRDSYLQRSAVLPTFRAPERFMTWFEQQSTDLVKANNL